MAFVTSLALHTRVAPFPHANRSVLRRGRSHAFAPASLPSSLPRMQTSPPPPDSSPVYDTGDEDLSSSDYSSESSSPSSPATPPTPSPPAADTTIDAAVRTVPIAELKCELYARAASVNRGLAASPAARADIEQIICELEGVNPTPGPATRPDLLCGEWKLIFCNALDILSLGLLAPVALVSDVYQNIFLAGEYDGSSSGGKNTLDYDFDVINVVQLEPPFAPVTNSFLGRTCTTVTVKATGTRTSDDRVDITFIDSSVRQTEVAGFPVPQVLPPLRVPLGRPVGYIDTTFLDEDLRILRAPPVRGMPALFVLRRESASDAVPVSSDPDV